MDNSAASHLTEIRLLPTVSRRRVAMPATPHCTPSETAEGTIEEPGEHQRPWISRLPTTTKGGRPLPKNAWRSLDVTYDHWRSDDYRASGLGAKVTPKSSHEKERGREKGEERPTLLVGHPGCAGSTLQQRRSEGICRAAVPIVGSRPSHPSGARWGRRGAHR
jgi:hypothetical protein